jgi:hypothetical protein
MKVRKGSEEKKRDECTKKRAFFELDHGDYPHFSVSAPAGRKVVTFSR